MDRERFDYLCAKHKVTIAELEKTLGMSNGSLRKEGDIKSSRLLALADYFDVSMEYLMGRSEKSISDANIELINAFNKVDRITQENILLLLGIKKDTDSVSSKGA